MPLNFPSIDPLLLETKKKKKLRSKENWGGGRMKTEGKKKERNKGWMDRQEEEGREKGRKEKKEEKDCFCKTSLGIYILFCFSFTLGK